MCDDKVKASKIIIAQGEEYEKKIAIRNSKKFVVNMRSRRIIEKQKDWD